VRCQILSKKISSKAISEPGLEASKILFYKFLIRYYVHEKEMLEASKAYQIIYNTVSKATPELQASLDP
jgi:26S proteasome regulatory subunit N5